MKLRDFLNQLGIKPKDDNLDSEIEINQQDEKNDDTKNQAYDKKEVNINIIGNDKSSSDTTKDNKVTNNGTDKNEQEEYMPDLSKIKFENGKFSGLKTLTEKDTELKALLESVNNYTDSKNAETAINDAIKVELGKYDITKGISESVVLNSLNRDSIKYLDNKVLGVEEAFASLAKENEGMLKIKVTDGQSTDKNNNSQTVEGPALDGFSKDMSNTNPLSSEDLVNFAFGND